MAADSHGQAVGVQYSLKVGAKGSWKSSQKSKSLINGPALTFFKVKKIKGETHQTIRWATTVHTTTTSNEILTLWQKDLPMVPVHQEEPSAWCYHHFLKKGGPIFHPTFFVPFSANFFFCCSKFCQAPQLSSQTSKSHGEAPSKGLAHICEKKKCGRRDERDMSAGSKIYNYLVWFHN